MPQPASRSLFADTALPEKCIHNEQVSRSLLDLLQKSFLSTFGTGKMPVPHKKYLCGTGILPVPNYFCKRSIKQIPAFEPVEMPHLANRAIALDGNSLRSDLATG
ncbi:hypothetical protein [Microcoleus sp. bin38.metabat.b11b12b14.051]|uniref:hypothetical protein n=1 Tax=Microcoleus sp. bin38.metabat.b11b12b14.051 TaxID=2742709 RepID=UPI0025E71F18|nr:hypothetical protein [Microcoleus sp. bin38.metabat.b11b12b14.051]